jgi:hypothetical protein
MFLTSAAVAAGRDGTAAGATRIFRDEVGRTAHGQIL